MKVSVIIPVYNMAPWIGHAIESVEKQTLKEIEIICIDDGSTDDTLAVLNICKQKYSNLVVLHQENQGSGPARNLGIENARGEYLAFLDADDYYYSDDALETLYRKAVEHQAVICRGSSCDDRNGVLSFTGLRPERVFDREGFVSSRDFPGPTGYTAGIYRRQFLLDNQIRFPDLRRGQDGVFSVWAIGCAGKAYCLDKVVYVYRKEHKDVVYTEEKATAAVTAFHEILRLSAQYGMDRTFACWKRELFGEPCAMLYKFAARGDPEMLELAHKLNKLIGGGLYEGDEIGAYVERVREEKPRFLERLRSLDAVYVFGAGTVGRRVIAWLRENGVPLTAVIVSDPSQNPETVAGIPVKPIEAIDLKQRYEVIIATFWYTQDAIAEALRAHGVEQIYPLDLCAFHLWQDEIVH